MNRTLQKGLMTSGIVCLIATGCAKRPEGVLSDDEMVSLIVDMQLADGYCNATYNGSHSSDNRSVMGERVLAAHGVTIEQLDSSLSWYGRNMDTYTELYEQVDKKMLERRKKLMKGTADDVEMSEGNNLWPYGKHGMISDLGVNDGYVFSVTSDELIKGDAIDWKMNISPSVPAQGVLGVEYTDGEVNYVSRTFQSQSKIEMHIQTDTALVVKRVFGTLRIGDSSRLPVMTDSISLVRTPLDSMQYYKVNSQRKYSGPKPVKRGSAAKAG